MKKKQMSRETAYGIKIGFSSLIKNASVVEAGKILPWWSALIIGIIGVFLPIIPTMVNVSKANGSDAISGNYNYSIDRDLTMCSIKMKNSNQTLTVGTDHLLHYNDPDHVADKQEIVPLADYVKSNGQYGLRVYYVSYVGGHTVETLFNQLRALTYRKGTTTAISGETNLYCPSVLCFAPDKIMLSLMKLNSTEQATGFVGNYDEVQLGDIISRVTTFPGVPVPAEEKDVTGTFINGCFYVWKQIFDESYLSTKNATFTNTTLIYEGIYVGLAIFLGLLMFLLTRGKRNINNYLKWYQCMKMSGWAALTPGLLSLILGFLLTNFAVMFFILFMGVRVMWLTMKQLSPSYQGQGK